MTTAVCLMLVASHATGDERPATIGSVSSLTKALDNSLPALGSELQGRGYSIVGVLKFRVQFGGGQPKDDAGPLNVEFANRLEHALVAKFADKLKVIERASETASTLSGASYLEKEGRAKLLKATYPLRWKGSDVKPDVILTGVLKVHDDLREILVVLHCFDRQDPTRLQTLNTKIRAPMDAITLSELGRNFSLKGGFDGGAVQAADAIEAANKVDDLKPLLVGRDAPVELQIFYGGELQRITFTNGVATVPEPKAGEIVELKVIRRVAGRARVAAVVKVNGENTLFRERRPGRECTKWILESGSPQIPILGFQVSDDKVAQFLVVARSASREHEIFYGSDLGLITLEVFPEQTADAAASDGRLSALEAASLPESKPKNPTEAQFKISAAEKNVIEAGARLPHKVERVAFKSAPQPIHSLTIRYLPQ
jgi:hypothetical protein